MKPSKVLLSIVMLAIALSTYTTTVSAQRRPVGPGKKVNFSSGTPITAASITFFKADGSPGRTWYECYMAHPTHSGYVIGEGTIDYDPLEVKGKTPCSHTKPNPGPRRLILAGTTEIVPAGHKVISPIIEAVPGRGKTFFKCLMTLPYKAKVFGAGVVDPHPAEIASARPCSQTTDWNPGRRMLTGDGGHLPFLRGDRVVGHLVLVNNVTHVDCYLSRSPGTGEVNSGVVNPYPGERELRPCLN